MEGREEGRKGKVEEEEKEKGGEGGGDDDGWMDGGLNLLWRR